MKEYQPSSLFYRLNNIVSGHIGRHISSESTDISYTNARIIRFIAAAGERDVYQKDVEKEFGITRSTASRVLVLMEKKGLVTRNSVRHDARLKKLMLTERSQRMNEILTEQSQRLDQIMLRGFSDEEARQLNDYFERIISNVMEEAIK